MKLLLGLCLLFVAAASTGWAQATQPYPITNNAWEVPGAVVPTTPTLLVAQDTQLALLHLSNTTGASVTVLITDNTTNCNGGPCQVWPTVTIGANTIYHQKLDGITAKGGVKWSASTANAVHGWIQGRY